MVKRIIRQLLYVLNLAFLGCNPKVSTSTSALEKRIPVYPGSSDHYSHPSLALRREKSYIGSIRLKPTLICDYQPHLGITPEMVLAFYKNELLGKDWVLRENPGDFKYEGAKFSGLSFFNNEKKERLDVTIVDMLNLENRTHNIDHINVMVVLWESNS